MITTKNNVKTTVAKLVVAVALTLAATVGSGVVGEQMGVEVASSVYANECSTSGGGGC